MQVKVRLQPIDLEPTRIGTGRALMAEEAWAHGPAKPRDVERGKEVPPEPVDLGTLGQKYDFIEILPRRRVGKMSEIENLPRDVSAFIVGGANFGLLSELCKLGKPILPYWDSFGYAWGGRTIREFVEETDTVCFVPFDAEDVNRIIRVLRGATFLRNMRVLYIGDIPSHSVRNANYDFDDMLERFGIRLQQIGIKDFEDAVPEAGDEEADQIARKWTQKADLLDGREEKLPEYAKIYLTLKKLVEQNDANAITMDCAYLSSVELVPCYPFATLIDEGIPCGCEGDTSALISMATLMGISDSSSLMGNLFSNTTHEDIKNNVIVINHDVVPPSMGADGKRMKLRDFHAMKKGLTGFVELEEGRSVTVAGMDRKARKLWCSSGKVVWTKDTVHCRTSIGVNVGNARRIGKDSFGHHQALAYGDWTDELEMLSNVLKIEIRLLDDEQIRN